MGLLGQFKDAVVLINRTSRPLNVRYDGEDMTIHPGENPGFPLVAVPFAKRQNPLMGTRHPLDPRKFITLVGVKGSKDDVSPISEARIVEGEAKLELMDRSGEIHGLPQRQVKVLNRKYTAYEAEAGGGGFDHNPNATE